MSTHQATAPQGVFEQAVALVLGQRIEGGYVNDSRDPGGETKFGISKRSYPKLNIKTLTKEDALAIYKRDFWDVTKCDELPPKIAVLMFDGAINQGPVVSVRLLQEALGKAVVTDGIIGEKTIAAAQKANEDELAIEFASWRLKRYAFTANAQTYMRGWSKRVLITFAFLLTELKVA